MKKGYILGIIIVVAIVGIGSYAIVKNSLSKTQSIPITSKATNLNNSNSTNNTNSTFSNQEQENYYKLSRVLIIHL